MSVLVLIYHRMSEAGGGESNVHCSSFASFRAQMTHLKKNSYEVLSWRAFERGAADRRDQIALSFDDGNASDLECARLVNSLGFEAVFFIATGFIGEEGYLTRDEILELKSLGMTIGSHTHGHVQLTPLDDKTAMTELTQSRMILEDLLQQPITHFSFPGGAYDERTLALARSAGYRYCYTSDWGLNDMASANGLLRRCSVLNHLSEQQFDSLLKQRHYYLRQIGFTAKELIKQNLGTERYTKLRRALINWRRSSIGGSR